MNWTRILVSGPLGLAMFPIQAHNNRSDFASTVIVHSHRPSRYPSSTITDAYPEATVVALHTLVKASNVPEIETEHVSLILEAGKPEHALRPDVRAFLRGRQYQQLQSPPAPSMVSKTPSLYRRVQTGPESAVYNGRGGRTAAPVGLWEPIFAQLYEKLAALAKSDRSALEVKPDQTKSTEELLLNAQAVYSSEEEREAACNSVIARLLDPERIRSNNRGVTADALAHTTIRLLGPDGTKVLHLLQEVKNEMGVAGDGELQAALSYCSHVHAKEYESIANVSSCPCILVSISGAYLFLQAAVYLEVPIVQAIHDPIYLGGDPSQDRIPYIAGVLQLVSEANVALKEKYRNLIPGSTLELKRFLPQPTYNQTLFPNPLNFIQRFRPAGTPDDDYYQTIYEATLPETGTAVLVKFSASYNKEAHRLLSDHGLAPKLHASVPLTGGFYMTVMDREDLKVALELLHASNLVFGDLRRPNVLIVAKKKNTELDGMEVEGDGELGAMLCDFDWAGVAGQSRYPFFLNATIRWPDGVGPHVVMQTSHDTAMFEELLVHV
ncbi:hypothetical protein B0H13DRAFT_2663262 [Mycena leptocephala]|nr:hypothetical protein B0H13DRAFT_2663262 [Mycena leptocephala]